MNGPTTPASQTGDTLGHDLLTSLQLGTADYAPCRRRLRLPAPKTPFSGLASAASVRRSAAAKGHVEVVVDPAVDPESVRRFIAERPPAPHRLAMGTRIPWRPQQNLDAPSSRVTLTLGPVGKRPTHRTPER